MVVLFAMYIFMKALNGFLHRQMTFEKQINVKAYSRTVFKITGPQRVQMGAKLARSFLKGYWAYRYEVGLPQNPKWEHC